MKPTPLLPAFLVLLSVAGCSSSRRFGDAGGVPVDMTVHVERPFFDNMSNRQVHSSVGAGAGFSNRGTTGIGLGIGLGFSSTSVFLIGGDGVGQADVFRKEVKWGDNKFTIPLRPGRTLVLGVQAEGGREGWESLGSVVVPMHADARIHVVMDADGGRVSVEPPAAAPVEGKAP